VNTPHTMKASMMMFSAERYIFNLSCNVYQLKLHFWWHILCHTTLCRRQE